MNYTPSNANLLANSCVGVSTPGGAVGAGPGKQNSRQLTGLWFLTANNPPGGVGPRTPRLSPSGNFLDEQDNCDRWYDIHLWGVEQEQFFPVSEFPTPRLPAGSSQIKSQGHRFTRVKARVEWETTQTADAMDIDIGSGTQFSLYAKSVRVKLLLPDLTYNPADPNNTPGRARGLGGPVYEVNKRSPQLSAVNVPLAGGLKIDSILGGTIVESCAPYGRGKRLTYTEQIVLEAAETGVCFTVPSHAKTLEIYNNTLPAEQLPWDFVPWCPPGGPIAPSFGQLVWGDGVLQGRNAEVIEVPQHAPYLRSPLVPYSGAASFTLVWGLDV